MDFFTCYNVYPATPSKKFGMALLFVFVSAITYGQNDELINWCLSDKSNFRVMSWLDPKKKMPCKFYVLDTTGNWNAYRFKLSTEKGKDMKFPESEHNAHYYLFRDTKIASVFSESERDSLA